MVLNLGGKQLAFNFREGYWGFQHLRLALCKRLFAMPADKFISRYQGKRVELLHDSSGALQTCKRCGFALVKCEFESGWFLEMCSALPLVDLNNSGFCAWVDELASEETLQDKRSGARAV